ncbi:hypothetical protein CAC01_24935 [Streptomyces sp. CLI2509]|nr:hypothetical protein CAC01_24935 [Streptomyces sp. CLI2509]
MSRQPERRSRVARPGDRTARRGRRRPTLPLAAAPPPRPPAPRPSPPSVSQGVCKSHEDDRRTHLAGSVRQAGLRPRRPQRAPRGRCHHR